MSSWAWKPDRYDAKGQLKCVAAEIGPPRKGRLRIAIPCLVTERKTGTDSHMTVKLSRNITIEQFAEWMSSAVHDQACQLRDALNKACAK